MTQPIDRFDGEWRFLSNFWPCTVRMDDGVEYRSAEHAYQATRVASSADRERLRQCRTAWEAKRLAKSCRTRDDWPLIKLRVMHETVDRKFRQNPDLLAQLLATGTRELIEGNYWGDTYWGMCRGRGENHLGRILMVVRAELRAELCAEDGKAGRQ